MAIHELIGIIERATEAKQVAFVAFIETQGAVDTTSYAAIERAMKTKISQI